MTSCNDNGCSQRDLLRRRTALFVWILPACVVLLGAAIPSIRNLLWIPCFTVMGTACLLNASRCGRLHCYLTSPLFLLGALLSALDALNLSVIDWRWNLVLMLLGTIAAFAFERARGTYVT